MNLQEPEDLKNTVRVSGRVFEESPYVSRYETDAMVRGMYAGRFFPIFNGEDPVQKYWVMRRKALIFDVPEKPVEISGPDAIPFLEKVLARTISTLKQGRGRYAVACTPQGGVFMDGVLFHLAADRYWYVQADGAFETWLLAFSGGFDVTISDPHSRVIQIQGPTSQAIMHAASAGQIDDTMGYFHAGFFDLGGQEVYVSRTGFTGELGFEIYSQGDKTDHLALWDHLMASGEPHGMEFSATSSMTMRRIEAGILGNGSDIDPSMTPFEAGLGWVVDLAKDDFVGRAALLDADQRPLLYGLTCAAALPAVGSTILDGDKPVGRMTMGVRSPTLDCGIGYVLFDEPGDWPGRTLQIRLPSGESHPCEIVELPFFDPEKQIARGLDRSIP
ncbi:MAG: aminomethyltransferase family protein [Alphaproteobacteria bacterium]|jgi:glycine cleavage system aminomethyltransferase T|nr:aminomethyl transferase family protein [Rhodospirillaceae bacterium]MBT6203058.1 aminomethyl transferase family protein [Rhodospirillaceae bacterium]MBT6510795.1 aminomethyl transferase family protein [Rhodospirillaceae bacterium]MBT7613217.1 aminomethyl transferase family protein [Rhodospirillaceae bacterium]MDG2482718.1 aminomethyltransferase family protein [Alphaproteobacteria bacterium]